MIFANDIGKIIEEAIGECQPMIDEKTFRSKKILPEICRSFRRTKRLDASRSKSDRQRAEIANGEKWLKISRKTAAER